MKIRGSVVSLSFILPHTPEEKKKKKTTVFDVRVPLVEEKIKPTRKVIAEGVYVLWVALVRVVGSIRLLLTDQ